MVTIIEDYVSFETAKLLKEKGFDVPCNCYGAYNGINLTYRLCITDKYTNWNKHTNKLIISCPTIQMAMKWLREVHKISIEITSTGYLIDNDVEWECDIKAGRRLYFRHITNEKSFESCAEAAIKYCLENLI